MPKLKGENIDKNIITWQPQHHEANSQWSKFSM